MKKQTFEEQLNCRVQGWRGYAKFGDTYNLQKKLFSKLSSIKNPKSKDI